ncbi:MAG: ABC transporter ATP-binding protein [Pseudomonadota bacterium]
MTAMVEITDVSKRFGDVDAVAQASLDVKTGAFLTVLGPSGSGKTTLLRMIAGFERPSGGEIRLAGTRVDQVPPWDRSIGMVFQRLALFPHMTAAENIAYPLKMRRWPAAEIPDRVADILRLVRLDGLGARRPHALSGGQQQRVAIARALVFKPQLLLLDEPLSALDAKLRVDMQLEFRRIQADLGVTTINVTHDQREALVMSDRIVVMEGGRIQQDGAPETLYDRPANRFVAGFIGQTTLFPGEVAESAPERVAIRVGDALMTGRPGPTLAPGTAVDCALRAERISIGTGENTVSGIVRDRIFEGDRLVYAVDVPAMGVTLTLFDHSGAEHAPGADIALGFAARDLLAFPREATDQGVTE